MNRGKKNNCKIIDWKDYYITYKLQLELHFEAILLSTWNHRQGLHEPRNEPLDFQRLSGP